MNENVMASKLSPMNERKRKMLMVLPLIIIPFLTLAFWSLGGGKGGEEQVTMTNSGLNLNLPDPKMKNETLDKLGFYDRADKDSLKRIEAMRNDPFYSDHSSIAKANELEEAAQNSAGRYCQSLSNDELNTSSNPNVAEQRLMQKLQELNKVVSQPPAKMRSNYSLPNVPSGNLDQLKMMMQSRDQQPENDPELQQLNTMMDKIIRIQHPEEFKEKKVAKNDSVAKVSAVKEDTGFNGFYFLETEKRKENSNAIEAVVAETQTLVSGAVIKLRLLSDIYIKEKKIPAGTFIYGITSLNGERLEISINSIRSDNSVYLVKLQVFDLDGLSGIYIPGAITREVAKQAANDNLNNMQLATLDPSLAAQATAAGITTMKNLLSKKVKQVKVFVKAGYQVLIKNKDA